MCVEFLSVHGSAVTVAARPTAPCVRAHYLCRRLGTREPAQTHALLVNESTPTQITFYDLQNLTNSHRTPLFMSTNVESPYTAPCARSVERSTEIVRRAAEFDADHNPKLMAFAVLGICNAVPGWYRPDGGIEMAELVRSYSAIALSTVARGGENAAVHVAVAKRPCASREIG